MSEWKPVEVIKNNAFTKKILAVSLKYDSSYNQYNISVIDVDGNERLWFSNWIDSEEVAIEVFKQFLSFFKRLSPDSKLGIYYSPEETKNEST